ncbi:MAG: DMT family transporter [Candidatus Omnitrophica bacterium]|nr:DMT family transporter [Candidatus Omnitrophota bacterium]
MGIVLAITFALLMTLITASSNVILKKGFFKIDPFIAVYLSVIISTALLWMLTFLFVPKSFFTNYKAIIVFVVIGSFAPTLVRTWTYYGIHKLGASRAAPLRAMTPFFATIIAILFLKESPRPGIFLGILLIVFGIVLLSKKEDSDFTHWKPRHLFYPLLAAFLAGFAANLRKYGLNLMPQPIFASTIAASSSLVILTIYIVSKYRRESILFFQHKKEMRLIFAAALLTTLGEIVDLSALLYGKVSLVVPIFAMTPLTIVFFSRIFLKKQEVVTRRLILSSILIIIGICFAIINAI